VQQAESADRVEGRPGDLLGRVGMMKRDVLRCARAELRAGEPDHGA